MSASAEYMDLPFEEAIRFFKQKVNIPTKRWNDLWKGMHARGFMVAGAAKDALLTDLHQSILKGIEGKATIRDFRKDFDEIVKKHGWKYKGGKAWRTGVIFNTNLRTAYAAGHHETMTDPDVLKARLYWRYVASSSKEPRDEHRKWYNLVLPHDDPFWKTHRPPNGWGCKCGLVNHSAREVERLKKEEADGPYPIKTVAPEIKTREWVDKATGKKHQVPVGIDPGWDYNVGEAAWGRTQALRLMEAENKFVSVDDWGPERYDRPSKLPIEAAKATIGKKVPKGDAHALRAALRDAIGGDVMFFEDPLGVQLMVGQAIVDHILLKPGRWDGREAYFPFIAELIQDPQEIWVGFAENQESGQMSIRRRYVKMVKIGKNKNIGLYAEFRDGFWIVEDFFRGDMSGIKRLRRGRLLYWK